MATPEASAAPPRLLVPILVVGLLAGAFVLLVWPTTPTGSGTHARARPVATPVETPGGTPGGRASANGDGTNGRLRGESTPRAEAEAAAILRAWDRRRAAAWAAGDAARLAALYVPGASAGRADVAMLGDWAARGLAVDDLRTQLLSVRVVARQPHRWVLIVRDRVAHALVAGGGLTEPLPAGATAEQEIVLRRLGGRWLVASVRPVPSERAVRP